METSKRCVKLLSLIFILKCLSKFNLIRIMFYIFLFLFSCIYYYKIIIFNIVVKRHERLVDVSAIKLILYFCNLTACGLVIS